MEKGVQQSERVGCRELRVKGSSPELLATDLLSRRGYRSIRTSFKPKVLGGFELDSLGIRSGPDSGECLVIETKRQSITDRELVQEIEKFTSKVRTLKGHLPEPGPGSWLRRRS